MVGPFAPSLPEGVPTPCSPKREPDPPTRSPFPAVILASAAYFGDVEHNQAWLSTAGPALNGVLSVPLAQEGGVSLWQTIGDEFLICRPSFHLPLLPIRLLRHRLPLDS